MSGMIARRDRQGFDVGTTALTITSSATRYLCPRYDSEQSSEALYYEATQPCIVDAIYAYLGTAPGTGETHALTIMKNGTASNMTLTISGTNTSGNTSSNPVNLSAGDKITIKSVTSSSAASAKLSCTLRIVPTVRA